MAASRHSLFQLLAFALGLLTTSASLGATGPDCQERPTELPPLLMPPTPPPANGNAAPTPGPRGPTGEYDHGLLYLPDYAPLPVVAAAPETCRPLGRWWVNPDLELAFISTCQARGSVRLRVPDGVGGSIPGPILPVGARSTGTFQTGFALGIGRFLGDAHTHAVEASLFTLGGIDRTFDGFAPGMLVIFPQGTARSVPQVVLLPPPLDTAIVGTFPVTQSTRFIGADVNYRRNLLCNASGRLDVLAGYRFAYLQDELFLGDSPDPGRDDYRRNRVAASNAFNGGQIGAAGEMRAKQWFVGGTAKVAFGVVTSEVNATGLFPGAEGADGLGFTRLAALSEGHQTRFAVLPTVNLTVGKQIREHTRVFAGYSFQYLSRAIRLGDVFDPTSTAATVTDFWVQSLNFGLELRY